MSTTQDMGARHGRAQNDVARRIAQLNAQGHQLNMEASTDRVVITMTRREGYAHHVMVTPEMIPDAARNAAAFQLYPQSVMIAYALNTIADWSADIDRRGPQPCTGCKTLHSVAANYNQQTGGYDWFCADCFYGAAA